MVCKFVRFSCVVGYFWDIFKSANMTYVQCGVQSRESGMLGPGFVVSDVVQVKTGNILILQIS